MALSVTKICNLSLSDLGSLRINNFDDATESSTQAILCRLHYEPVRDALLRRYSWRFARARKILSRDTVTPDFEWAFQYALPTDYMAMVSIYEGRFSDENVRNYALEGDRLLTDESTDDSTLEIRYVKKVTDVTKFDPLFVQLLVLQLDLKLVMPLTQSAKLKQSIKDDIKFMMPDVLAVTGQEVNTAGRLESSTWNDGRFGDNAGFPMRY